MNKKILPLALLTGLIIGSLMFYVNILFVHSQPIDDNYAVLMEKAPNSDSNPLTLLVAWDIVYTYATNWSKDATLISLGSADINDFEVNATTGLDGKRRTWQAVFTSAKVNKQLFLQITDGVIVSAIEDGIHDVAIPVITEKPTIDSSTALQQVKSAINNFEESNSRAKGYHFILQTDTHAKAVLTIVGSQQTTDKKQLPVVISINPQTGKINTINNYVLEGGSLR